MSRSDFTPAPAPQAIMPRGRSELGFERCLRSTVTEAGITNAQFARVITRGNISRMTCKGTHTPEKRGARKVVLVATLFAAMFVLACRSGTTGPKFHVTEVTVFLAINGSLRIGDTTTARAHAYFEQLPLPNAGPFTWSVGDSTIVHLEATSLSDRVIVQGIKTGTTVLRATVSGITGVVGVTVVP